MNVVQVVVGPTGFVGAPEQAIVDYIRSTFADRPKPDLIVTVAGPAAVFARKYRQQLFPDTPLLFAAVDQRFLRDAPLGENETAVAVVNDFPRLVDDILQLLPQTRQVFMVMGSGLLGTILASRARGRVQAISRSADVRLVRRSVPSGDPAPLCEPATRTRRSSISPSAPTRRAGRMRTSECSPTFTPRRMLPCLGCRACYFGSGIVGGTLMSIDDLGRNTADVAIRLLNGAPPRSIRVPPQRPGQPIFDWRELQRWGIPESRLPAGSVVRYRSPSLWAEYRLTVLSAVGALVVQSLLIVGLLYQRRARQRAEIESRRNLALAADASRRQTMSALTSSIAHELGQPLSSMIHNAQALQMMITANRATPDTIGEILSDIQSAGRPRHADHRSPSDHAPKSSAGQETDRPSRRDHMKALPSSPTT